MKLSRRRSPAVVRAKLRASAERQREREAAMAWLARLGVDAFEIERQMNEPLEDRTNDSIN